MKIRETVTIVRSNKLERQQQILDNIAELEQQHEDGVIETPAYLIKKRALVKML